MIMDKDYSHIEKIGSRQVPAGEFKARCLRLMDEVRERGTEIVITKHGKPVARLVPVADDAAPVFGAMKGTVRIVGDIVAPIDVAWKADSEQSSP